MSREHIILFPSLYIISCANEGGKGRMFVQVKEGRERKGLGMVVGMDSNKSNTSFHI